MTRKKYEDLSLIDNFMINAVATDPEKAEPAFRIILSVLLQRKIDRVSVTAERFVPGMLPGQRGYKAECTAEGRVYDFRISD